MIIYVKLQRNAKKGYWQVDRMDNRLIENEIFYCEPLMATEENLRLIQKFHVATETGIGLELYLKKYAVSDEISHEARTYLVKDNVTDEIDSRNQPDGYIPFLIDLCDNKAHLILLSGHPVIIAGVGNGVDTDMEPDKDGSLVDIRDRPGIFSLYLASGEVCFAGVAVDTLHVRLNGDIIYKGYNLYWVWGHSQHGIPCVARI